MSSSGWVRVYEVANGIFRFDLRYAIPGFIVLATLLLAAQLEGMMFNASAGSWS
jgi:hypothetical protein